ncbi:MAG: helix-turn-helix domain-containing protein [Peptostreptococcaceae bacterium]
MSNVKFMKIPTRLFTNKDKLLTTDGLSIYSLMLCKEDRLGKVQITTKMIKDIGIAKDNKKITNIIQLLHRNKFIKIDDKLLDIDKISDSTVIDIEISEVDQFIKMPYIFYYDNINKIGSIAYAIISIMVMYHNCTYGGVGCMGFSNPSYNHLADIIGVSKNTIIKNIKILEKNKLIKIEVQPIITMEDNTIKQESNHYIVKMLVDNKNKYYCPK